MKINLNKQLFYHSILIFMGLFTISYYIWFRFIRERLPRDIPFHLTSISFMFLCCICIIYFYAIYKILKILQINKRYKIYELEKRNEALRNNSNNSYYFYLILNKLKFLVKPLVALHNFFFIQLNFYENLINIFYNIVKKYKLYNDDINEKILLLLDFFPKFIILFFFLLDVFYFKQLNIFYSVIILGLIPICYSYSIYSCANGLEILMKDLEENYYVKILSTTQEEDEYSERFGLLLFMCSINSLKYEDDELLLLNSRYFIEMQAKNLVFEHSLYKYTCIETTKARETYAEKHNIQLPALWIMEPESDKISKQLSPYFFNNIKKAIYLQAFLDVHTTIAKPTMIEKHLLIILIAYMIGWSYILLVSIHTLNLSQLVEILINIKDITEPF